MSREVPAARVLIDANILKDIGITALQTSPPSPLLRKERGAPQG
jgi:hypothetical protein